MSEEKKNRLPASPVFIDGKCIGKCVLAVVTGTCGSTPRSAGAWMLVGKNGRMSGTIGGAAAEHLAIEEAKKLLKDEKTEKARRVYVLHPAESADIGARCGGEMTVDFLVVDSTRNDTVKAAEDLLARYEKPGLVYVFGGGHVAQATVPLLARVGFRCVVFEDREDFATASLFPDALSIVRGSFTDIGASGITLTRDDWGIVLTRGHEFDYQSEAFLLESPARYIGVIGSREKKAFVHERLKKRGFSDSVIRAPRVHAPIGIDIHSDTPEEIAVSIAAEMIAIRNGRDPVAK